MASMPIALARHRATLAKRTLAAGSVLAFVVTIGLARSSHPARAASTTAGSSQTAPGYDNGGYGFAPASENAAGSGGFGQADAGPATGSQTPSVSTGAS